ncbi:MAG: hypothetical protein M0Q38_09290 [Bacteroidales bacterium]|jgi:hypothetical protein|nr:hypothetical protein [Bacteroidales bacterium]
MKIKLILQLSLFGLAMAIATVFFISSTNEPFCWLAIIIICAYIIAKKCTEKYFLNGLCVGLVNSVWVTAAHIIFFETYLTNHPQEAAMVTHMPFPDSPRLMMLMTGPVIGLISGLFIGLFSLCALKFTKKMEK